MEKTKKSKRKTSSDSSAEKIISAYREFLLTEGKQPSTVYKFCLDLGIPEDTFYKYFGSFDALEGAIWQGYMEQVKGTLQADDNFIKFSAREKILSLYFSLAEVLRSNRSFNLLLLNKHRKPEIIPGFLKGFKSEFNAFIEQILSEGKSSGEVAQRPFVDKRYPDLFWVHLSFMLLYWKEDESPSFEKTDAFIEKSVNLAFDLIGKGAVDSAIDFAKFIYQSKVK